MESKPRTFTRRDALRLLMSAGALVATPWSEALADTQADLDSARQRYAEVEEQLNNLAAEYEELSIQQSGTLDEIEVTNGQISETETKIAGLEEQLSTKRERLGKRIASAYKAGTSDVVSVFLSSDSFEDLGSNIYYLDKISEQDRQMIDDIEATKGELDEHKLDLEGQKAQLEELSATQQEQLASMQEKQEETAEMLDSLDDEVKKLVAKRDKELAEAARQAEEQRKAKEAAEKAAAERAAAEQAAAEAAAAAAEDETKDEDETGEQEEETEEPEEDDTGESAADDVTGELQPETQTGSQAAVVAACHSTGSPGGGLCAMWVSMVFENAGYGYAGGNANDMYNAWCDSSDRSQLRTGMVVAVSTHPHTWAGQIYGHIGIYIGDGVMMDNIGYIRTISVDEWIAYYGATVTPRWGWLMDIELT